MLVFKDSSHFQICTSLFYGALSLTGNRPNNEAPPNVQQDLPSHSLPPPSISFPRRHAELEFWTDKHTGTNRIQAIEMLLLPNMWRFPTLPFSPQTPSTVGLRLPQLPLDPRELLLSSSHMHRVPFGRNVEPDDLPPEAMLQNLTGYITKDKAYPVARGAHFQG
ncbi:hypothetical protein BDR06DRAFT_1002808 [Suillus hirtellus]|nr:hypothetical protein BDR06DRAFT_1002808 [Suillus hirtellus]